MTETILEVRDLVKHFPLTRGIVFKKTVGQVKAVDGVSFDLHAGETLGVVGESGCGKSTLAQVLMNLEKPTAGTVALRGPGHLQAARRGAARGCAGNIQLVMQDPYTSLNPRMTVGDIVGEPFEIHPEVAPKGSRRRKVQELLDLVGPQPGAHQPVPAPVLRRSAAAHRHRPGAGAAARDHRLRRAGVGAGRVDPGAGDEPAGASCRTSSGCRTSSSRTTCRWCATSSDRVAVMYLGKIVEIGTEDEIYERPTHPYTQALLSAVPVPDPTLRGQQDDHPAHRRRAVAGRTRRRAAGSAPAAGRRRTICAEQEPLLEIRPGSDHPSACHFAEKREIVATHEA